MKKQIKFLSAVILVVSISVTFFSACKLKNNDSESLEVTETTIVYGTDYTYTPLPEKNEEKTEYIFTPPVVPTEKETKKPSATANLSADINEIDSSAKKPSGGNINEDSNGLHLITKTTPVSKNNTATILIQGTPNSEYSIEFYKNDMQKAEYEGLNDANSDPSGFASWTFLIGEDCEIGERKLIIKEKNSDKYIQTSITVQ